MKIEVLRCKSCGRLAISVDDKRIDTNSCAAAGHGSGKCAGQWTIQVDANLEQTDLSKSASPSEPRNCPHNINWPHDCERVEVPQGHCQLATHDGLHPYSAECFNWWVIARPARQGTCGDLTHNEMDDHDLAKAAEPRRDERETNIDTH